MTDVDKLFMVKINNMTEKKTGESSWLLMYLIIAFYIQKLCLIYFPTVGFIHFMQLLKGNYGDSLFPSDEQLELNLENDYPNKPGHNLKLIA